MIGGDEEYRQLCPEGVSMVIGGYQVYICLCSERDMNPYTLKAMIYWLLL